MTNHLLAMVDSTARRHPKRPSKYAHVHHLEAPADDEAAKVANGLHLDDDGEQQQADSINVGHDALLEALRREHGRKPPLPK